MERILSTLQHAADTSGTNGPVFTLLVGHDTNLANIGGMLGLHWSLPSYLANETPPAGAMHFDLLRDRETKVHAVRIRYIAQTLDQMRRMVPLDLARPPETAVVKIDGCKQAKRAHVRGPNSQRLQTGPSIAPALICDIEIASRRRRW